MEPDNDDRYEQISAHLDGRLVARVIARRALRYSPDEAPDRDRPPHVRAGSGLSRLGGRLAVIQDDANFVALVDPASGEVESLALPAGAAGQRVFDGASGKAHKLDLESCVGRRLPGEDVLVAFGSGSTGRRERVAIVRCPLAGARPEVCLAPAAALYSALRARTAFSGSELNIEGAAWAADGILRLFQRGNGAPREGLGPVDATCDLPWSDCWAYLRRGGAPPPVSNIVQYDLGRLDDVRLTITDAVGIGSGRILYLATAEDSPDAYRDGAVTGTAVGLLDRRGHARWTPLRDGDGASLCVKAEGIVADPTDASRVHVVLDADDPRAPAELLTVELAGPWPSRGPSARG